MAGIRLLFFAVAFAGCSATLAEEASVESVESSSLVRDPRSLHKNKLCRKYGICLGGGFGGYGGYGGYQGNQGYQGYPEHQGYQPPINIAISQSQSSANEGGGGHGSGYFPNNYQYNGGHPNQGYPHQGYYSQGYSSYDGYGGYNRPGYGNGNGGYNNQYNGNFYSGSPNGPHGGYGFQSPFGFRDESEGGDYDIDRNNNFAYARSSATAVAGNKNE